MSRKGMEDEAVQRDLAEKVSFLSRCDAYPGATNPVEVIATHMSWVFLTEEHAWKMKKPVFFSFLDFRGLEDRRRSVEKELTINQDLAPGIYLQRLPLLRETTGRLRLGTDWKPGDSGRVVDWLLKMKRLPRQSMLDHAINNGVMHGERLPVVAHWLCAWYRNVWQKTFRPGDYSREQGERIKENLQVLSRPVYGLDPERVAAVHERQQVTRQSLAGLLEERAAKGRVRDGHGDLRPEHICLTDPPVIIDRLEVDPDGRAVDPVDELSLLAIECELLGHPEVGELFFRIYREDCDDPYPEGLANFFRSLRACTRARFAAWHLDDPQVKDKAKWQERTQAYFAIGERWAA